MRYPPSECLPSAAEIEEVQYDGGGAEDEYRMELEQERIEMAAEELIESAEGLREVDAFAEFSADAHSDLARMFRNLTDAVMGKQYAVHAILQCVINLRNRCRDDAIRMVADR